MSLTVIMAVLLAALLHAAWNALLRFQGDRLSMMALLAAASGIFALPWALWLGLPDPAAWPWLAGSVLMHLGYNTCLAIAYGYGDLGRIYPLARGAAPLLTLAGGILFIGEMVAIWPATGIVILAASILLIAFENGWRVLREAPRGAIYALVTSFFIAGYTLLDGQGARVAGNPHAYVAWLFVLDGIPLLTFGLLQHRSRMMRAIADNWRPGLSAGMASLAAYWIAIWAMTIAPIAVVAALRESSVLFAMLLGVLFLGESFTWRRLLSVLGVLAGLLLLRI